MEQKFEVMKLQCFCCNEAWSISTFKVFFIRLSSDLFRLVSLRGKKVKSAGKKKVERFFFYFRIKWGFSVFYFFVTTVLVSAAAAAAASCCDWRPTNDRPTIPLLEQSCCLHFDPSLVFFFSGWRGGWEKSNLDFIVLWLLGHSVVIDLGVRWACAILVRA